ncbi:HEPN domain-containing protein [Paenibacillus sp. KN14-4R]|uniref:HEPN domain-containing protein n=1 Tax=Paenibacillus sp. KN14-4R TaxID=3445773 RepID=UPI003F9ECFCB
MPSKSYKAYRNNSQNVTRLIDNYRQLKTGKGRTALDHLTRSGIILLASSWEVYIEDVLNECVTYYIQKCGSASKLPDEVKKTISKEIKTDKNELSPFELVEDSWKEYYSKITLQKTKLMNTPKKDNINNLFKNYLGVDELSSHWTNKTIVNKFVSYRGDIVHKVKADSYVRVETLEFYLKEIEEIIKETDLYLKRYLTSKVGSSPWNNTY